MHLHSFKKLIHDLSNEWGTTLSQLTDQRHIVQRYGSDWLEKCKHDKSFNCLNHWAVTWIGNSLQLYDWWQKLHFTMNSKRNSQKKVSQNRGSIEGQVLNMKSKQNIGVIK